MTGAPRKREDLVIMPRYNQGINSWSYLNFVVVTVHREVFNMIPDSLMLIVQVERIWTVLRCLTVRGSCSVILRPLSLEMRPRRSLGVTLVSMVMMVMLVLAWGGSRTLHCLEGCVCLLLGLLDNSIDIWHHWYTMHTWDTTHEKHIVWISVHLSLPSFYCGWELPICFKLYL